MPMSIPPRRLTSLRHGGFYTLQRLVSFLQEYSDIVIYFFYTRNFIIYKDSSLLNREPFIIYTDFCLFHREFSDRQWYISSKHGSISSQELLLFHRVLYFLYKDLYISCMKLCFPFVFSYVNLPSQWCLLTADTTNPNLHPQT